MFNRQALFHSLKARITVSALLMVIVLLPIVGFTISNAYQKHMEAGLKNELTAYSYSLLAVAEFEDGLLIMPEAMADDRFNINQSGLYAFITASHSPKNTLWQSDSLLALKAPSTIVTPTMGNNRFYRVEIEQQSHFIYSFSVSFDGDNQAQQVTLHIVKAQAEFQLLMGEFRQQLTLGLLVLSAILIALQFIWLRWSLMPLSKLKQEIVDIEQGKHQQLSTQYPTELSQVAEQLNTLLTTEQQQRTRYRNALSDLAHSLKTPLAVLQGQISANNVEHSQEHIDVMRMMIEHQLKRAQSAGQSSWYLGVEISPVLEKLINSLSKIYHDKAIDFIVEVAPEIIFKGDEADLLEILGNLLDNACKAAKGQVAVKIIAINNQVSMIIEDDGQGIAEDKISQILERGKRADTYKQGHGIGLAIVRDLVESYQASLMISASENFGGAKFSLIF